MRQALALFLFLLMALPAAAQPSPGGRNPAEELDRAFAALREAPDEQGGRMAEAVIRQIWARAATPAVGLLLNRGVRNMRAGQPGDALEDFDAAITLAPRLADPWYWRAQAYAAAQDDAAAARDLAECLRIEPRHWPALIALSRIQEGRGDLAGALRSFEAALAIHPTMPGARQRLEELRRKAEGDDT
jgi:tetratricopeptide (TPR) repeat protein